MRLGLIVRYDSSGLGNQTYALTRLLKPDKLLRVAMHHYSNLPHHNHWYAEYKTIKSNGLPKLETLQRFVKNLDVAMSCETFYNAYAITLARQQGIKTILQYNYEFLDILNNPNYPMPDILIAPSKWKFDEVDTLVNKRNDKSDVQTKLIYIPPPLFNDDFREARLANFARTQKDKARFLHVVGRSAIHDRNGTLTLLEAVRQSKSDFELVITAQENPDFHIDDSRITLLVGNQTHPEQLYANFDALIMPRRYGGLCLPMNEALMSALPVIMTDVSPNNLVLPKEWLVNAKNINQFKARTMIDVYEADIAKLSQKIDELVAIRPDKEKAYKLAVQYDSDYLEYEYNDMFESL